MAKKNIARTGNSANELEGQTMNDRRKPRVRLTTRIPSKRYRELAKKMLSHSDEFPPRFADQLKKIAAGEPNVTAFEIIYPWPRKRRKTGEK